MRIKIPFKLKYILACIVGIITFSHYINCFAEWAPTEGPYGSVVNDIVFHPTNSQIMYAGTVGGVFKTTDGGVSWQIVFNHPYINRLAIDPVNPDIIYAGIRNGEGKYDGTLYKSTDSGATWEEVNVPYTSWITAIAIDPNDTEIIYIGTEYYNGNIVNGVYKSTDGGNTWEFAGDFWGVRTPDDPYSGMGHLVTSLAIDPIDSNIVYAGSWPLWDGTYFVGYVWKSMDGGASWSLIWSGLTESRIQTIAIDPNSPNTVYAGTYLSGVFKSVNGGIEWNYTGLQLRDVMSLVVDKTNSNIIYAATRSWDSGISGGFFKSTDGGTTWVNLNVSIINSDIVFWDDMENGTTNWTADSPWTQITTDSHGPTTCWTDSPEGNYDNNVDISLTSTTINLSNATSTYLTFWHHYDFELDWDYGLLEYSTDGGVNWDTIGIYTGTNTTWTEESCPLHFLDGQGQLQIRFRLLSDSSITADGWFIDDVNITSNDITTNITNTKVLDLAIDPNNSNIISIGTEGGGVFKSSDQGTNWSEINIGLGTPISSVVVNPVDSSKIIAGGYGSGMFESTDGGLTWQTINTGLKEGFVTSVAFNPIDTDTIYVGTYALSNIQFYGTYKNLGGVYKSTDGGVTWFDTTNDMGYPAWIKSVAVNPLNPNIVYAGDGGGYGVFKSTNGGQNWRQINTGLTDLDVQAIVIDPKNPDIIYAGTYLGGVFKSTDGGRTWVPTPLSAEGFWLHHIVEYDDSAGTLSATITYRDTGAPFLSLNLSDIGPFSPGMNKLTFSNNSGGYPVPYYDNWAIGYLDNLYFYEGTPLPLVYATDFSNDPNWTTGYSEGTYPNTDEDYYYWDSNNEWYYIEQHNKWLDGSDHYVYTPITYTGGSFKIRYDMFIERQGYNATLKFGLKEDPKTPWDLNESNISVAYGRSDGGKGVSVSGCDANGNPFSGGRFQHENTVFTLAIDSTDSNVIYAGTYGGVYKTTDGANTWRHASSGLTSNDIKTIVIDPSSPNTIYAGTWGGGVFKSLDSGDGWGSMNAGTISTYVASLSIRDTSSHSIYAGTYAGTSAETSASISSSDLSSGVSKGTLGEASDGSEILSGGVYRYTPITTTGIIKGRISNYSTGDDIEGANVAVKIEDQEIGVKTFASDVDYNYIILDLPAGTGYTITVSATDYCPNSQGDVKVNSGEITTVNLTLTRKSMSPCPVSNLKTIPGDQQITLSWTNPDDSYFVSTMIRYRTDGNYPENEMDGQLVCDEKSAPGTEDSYVHDNLTNGVKYYYTVYTYDEVSNYSSGIQATSTPQSSSDGGGGGGGGCFIATAAYGTPMAKEVIDLMNVRDEYLLTNSIGRVLISFYLKISPPIADFIQDKESLKNWVRFGLKPFIWFSKKVLKIKNNDENK